MRGPHSANSGQVRGFGEIGEQMGLFDFLDKEHRQESHVSNVSLDERVGAPITDSPEQQPNETGQLSLFNMQSTDIEVKELSFSQLSLFLQCKFRYKAKYIDKRLRQDEQTTFYLSVGRSLHLTLAAMFRANNSQEARLSSVNDMLRANWSSEGFKSSREEAYWFDHATEMIQGFITRNHTENKTILIETPFRSRIDNLYITSRIDRVDKINEKECIIIDYKTGSAEPDIDLATNNLQWIFHYLASKTSLEQAYDLHIRSINFCFLESGTNIEIEPEVSKIAEATSKLINIQREIERETIFPATMNKYCTDCMFQRICPAIQELRRGGIDPLQIIDSLI